MMEDLPGNQSLDMDDSFLPFEEPSPRYFFWSLKLVPGKRYSQQLTDDLHITHASIGEDAAENSVSILHCETEDNQVHPICRLREGKTDQMSLSLFFPAEGELTLFTSKTSATVHLLGHFQEVSPEDDEDSEDEEEEEEEEDEEVDIKSLKRKAQAPPAQEQPSKKVKDLKKKAAATASAPNLGKLKEAPKKEVAKKEAPKKKKEVAKKEVAKKETPKKEVAKKEAPKKDASKEELGVSKKLAMGVVATVVQAGRGGPAARDGKKVKVQYKGTLQKGGKQFDAGKIDFRLGVGDVIKGWDVGVNGMKLGEKRILIIPPGAGYGKRGAPPDIPGNSTLKFEVTLLNIQ